MKYLEDCDTQQGSILKNVIKLLLHCLNTKLELLRRLGSWKAGRLAASIMLMEALVAELFRHAFKS